MRKLLLLTAALAPLAPAEPARASDDRERRCPEIAAADWISLAEVEARLTELGYRVHDIEREDGCYEVEGRDANGASFEAVVHPATGEILPHREKRS